MNNINPLIWVAILVIVILAIYAYMKHMNKPKPAPEPPPEPTLKEVREETLRKAELDLAQAELNSELADAMVIMLKTRIERLKDELG